MTAVISLANDSVTKEKNGESPNIARLETIDVKLKGIDDGIKSSRQEDYKQAVLFAKREAIERSGVEIKSISKVENLALYEDFIEAKAQAVLLGGYEILDLGYSEDGLYQVVLIGKIRTSKTQ